MAEALDGQGHRKLSYAVMLPRWKWMLGTGIYLDAVDAAAAQMKDNLFKSVSETLLWMSVVGVAARLAAGSHVVQGEFPAGCLT